MPEKIKLSKKEPRKWRWAEISMTYQITFLVFLLFFVYALVFQLVLHNSAWYYREQIDQQLDVKL
jgi:hypothetical protein